MKILLLNGVNMDMLGKRNADYYGTDTLAQLEQKVTDYARSHGVSVVCAQSNCEGELVNILHKTDCDAVILNAGAYSHYSYALRDCIECIAVPVIEVHLSDIFNREDFRKVDVLKDVCAGFFYGKGIDGYFEAVDFAITYLKSAASYENNMYIKKIADYDDFSDEADVIVTDGVYEIMCYCYPVSKPKPNQIVNSVSTFMAEDIMTSDEEQCARKTEDGYYSYYLVGKVIDCKKQLISIGKLIIKLDGYMPGDIRVGDTVQLSASRVEAKIKSE